MYDLARISIEVVSAIACVILVRFMLKPFQLTREGRYAGLPLGFGILGLSYVLTIPLLIQPFFNEALTWLAHLARVFAFVFLGVTYYFSKKPTKNSRLLWNLTLSLLIVALIFSSLFIAFTPQSALVRYGNVLLCLRILSLIFLGYVIFHTLRSHLAKPDTKTIWIPLGFLLIAIGQILLLFALLSGLAYPSILNWGGWLIRVAGLAVFLMVSYQAFYCEKENK